jgi:hypothetical protein
MSDKYTVRTITLEERDVLVKLNRQRAMTALGSKLDPDEMASDEFDTALEALTRAANLDKNPGRKGAGRKRNPSKKKQPDLSLDQGPKPPASPHSDPTKAQP